MTGANHAISSLYVHVPFCASKCAYCAFVSAAAEPVPFDCYFEALRAEARPWLARLRPRTVYVGGGTPSLLDPPALARLLGWIRSLCPAPPDEWTVEANPESLDAARVAVMARSGVTRISLGVQSFDDAVLRFLRRRHDAGDGRRAAALARGRGGVSLALDLIAAAPVESEAGWSATVDEALALAPDHVSVYCLSWEAGTPLTSALRAGRTRRLAVDAEIRRLRVADRKIRAAGLRRYEISNYARPGAACRHNLGCWRMRPYLGLGPGAASFVDGVRWTNDADVEGYPGMATRGADIRREVEPASPERTAMEAAAFGIRVLAGWTRPGFARATGCDWDDLWPGTVAALRAEGLLVPDADRLKLTRKGRLLADLVAASFLDTDAGDARRRSTGPAREVEKGHPGPYSRVADVVSVRP